MNSQSNWLKKRASHCRALPGKPTGYDYEYERNGTASIFMFCEPLSGKRTVEAHEHRTMTDWAEQIKHLLDVDYPTAQKVILICDHLNTHKPAALYKTFPPKEARRLLNRLEIHHTPKHGSWLNIAEIELTALTRQCLDRRIPDLPTLQSELAAWNTSAKRHRQNHLLAVHYRALLELNLDAFILFLMIKVY